MDLLRFVVLGLFSVTVCGLQDSLLFATKTPYDLSRKLFGQFVEQTLKQPVAIGNFYPTDFCEPVQVSLLLRHGSRFPSPGDVEAVAEFVEFLKGAGVRQDYEHLKEWVNPFTMEVNKQLGHAGFNENVGIAKRTVANFRQLFSNAKENPEGGDPDIVLIASNTSRTIASAKGFASGLTDSLSIRDLSEHLKLDNSILRFFDVCRKYTKAVESNKTAVAEFHTFRNGPEMAAAAERVSLRLGLSSNRSLTTDELKTIWVMCGYETSLFKDKPSRWCSLLTQEETDVLEYAWDLKSYWKKAYGHQINYAQSCPLVDHMIGNLEKAANGQRGAPKMAAYFGHAETVLPVLAALGLFNDSKPLLASNFEHHRKSRSFRSSYIASFASNVALVLYRCQQRSNESEPAIHPHWHGALDEVMVQLLVNEHALPFPFAGGRLAVPYAEMRSHYAYQLTSECRFDNLCSTRATQQQQGVDKAEDTHDEL